MLKRLRREKDRLLTFLEVDGVELHNNSAERGIRPCVILCNNSYGSRFEEGASAIAVLMSVKQTCKAKNDNFLDAMRTNLFKTCQKYLITNHLPVREAQERSSSDCPIQDRVR